MPGRITQPGRSNPGLQYLPLRAAYRREAFCGLAPPPKPLSTTSCMTYWRTIRGMGAGSIEGIAGDKVVA